MEGSFGVIAFRAASGESEDKSRLRGDAEEMVRTGPS